MRLYPTFISFGNCDLLKVNMYVLVLIISSFLLIEIRLTSETP